MKGVVDVAPFLLFPAMSVYGLRMSIFRRISYETRFRQNQPYVHSLPARDDLSRLLALLEDEEVARRVVQQRQLAPQGLPDCVDGLGDGLPVVVVDEGCDLPPGIGNGRVVTFDDSS